MSGSSSLPQVWPASGSNLSVETSGGSARKCEPDVGSVRFWSKVDRSLLGPAGCWHWTGALNSAGYGVFAVELKPVRLALAHRVMFTLDFGAIPDGLIVRHRCDVPNCVRPDHLLLGTHRDNAQDKIQRGRAQHQRARLTQTVAP